MHCRLLFGPGFRGCIILSQIYIILGNNGANSAVWRCKFPSVFPGRRQVPSLGFKDLGIMLEPTFSLKLRPGLGKSSKRREASSLVVLVLWAL